MYNPKEIFRPVIEIGAITFLLTFGYHMMQPAHPCEKYEFGPWALNGLPEDRRFEYVSDCGAPEPPPGYAWASDYSLVPEKA